MEHFNRDAQRLPTLGRKVLPMWECPECERRFGRTNQGHECAPALSIEEYFEASPEFERPIFDAVLARLQAVDPDIWFEPVSVGIFFKRRTVFLALRTMTKWVAVCFHLDRRLDDPRISRKVVEHGGRYYHVVNVGSVDEVDDDLAGWLIEAWEHDQ